MLFRNLPSHILAQCLARGNELGQQINNWMGWAGVCEGLRADLPLRDFSIVSITSHQKQAVSFVDEMTGNSCGV